MNLSVFENHVLAVGPLASGDRNCPTVHLHASVRSSCSLRGAPGCQGSIQRPLMSLWPCAAENMHLSEEVSLLREEAAADEAEALRDDVALLRTEVIRLSDEVKRLQSAPRVSAQIAHVARATTAVFSCAQVLVLDSVMAEKTELCIAVTRRPIS